MCKGGVRCRKRGVCRKLEACSVAVAAHELRLWQVRRHAAKSHMLTPLLCNLPAASLLFVDCAKVHASLPYTTMGM